ncbi:hypothetical protein [Microcoleus sp. F4-D5]|uniref:hypothetical protein n=1 Tax=Microcoleus sp. F4-D5 TaxID=2818760 RepID=UPI002FD0D79E
MPAKSLRGFSRVGSILCCDTVLGAIETFKTSIELIDRFPQSTSLAKINRWRLGLAVFDRSNWLVEGLQEVQKMPRSGKKSKSNSNGTVIASLALAASVVSEPPPNISQGLDAGSGALSLADC